MLDLESFSQRIINSVKGYVEKSNLQLKLDLRGEASQAAVSAANAHISEKGFMSSEEVKLLVQPLVEQNETNLRNISKLVSEIQELRSREPSAPEPVVVDYEKISAILSGKMADVIKNIVTALPVPDKGDPGVVDMVAVEALIADHVKSAVGGIVVTPEQVDYEKIMDAVSADLDARVKSIELPSPEKVDMELVNELISEAVNEAVTPAVKSAIDAVELPAPEGVDYTRVSELILETVVKTASEEIAKIELPSINEEALETRLNKRIRSFIMQAVGELDVETKLEEQKQLVLAGQGLVPALIEKSVDAAISQISLPEAKEPDQEKILQMVVSSVKDYLGGMNLEPKEVDVETLKLGLIEVVKSEISGIKIPVPEPVRAMASALVNNDGDLIVIFTDGQEKNLGHVRGRDGFQVRDFEASVMEDGQTLLLTLGDDELKYSQELFFPAPVYKGTFKRDASYTRGSIVTFAGSMWHAEKDAPTGVPGDGNPDWKLAVKKGRDYKEPVKLAAKTESVK